MAIRKSWIAFLLCDQLYFCYQIVGIFPRQVGLMLTLPN